ncbi:LacI family DNA-binding transcriptional regulator [Mangrovicoccus sp. HB161399]|uniref:LacI family DNA-binding transcriptional regulator n=1 Tax=Mangrovicoccus sp. HB161399 TaxID=2720392 RepID=UPI001552C8C0|nr:LacI family DNA-binding transcriptional regulator [Mangrovicoccus sp. HB161399]
MIGIKDLARHLDISIGTVSRALNGRPDVNPETRARVMQAAQELGYVPNQSGRSLKAGATNTVGFMVMTSQGGTTGASSFFMEVAAGIQEELREEGMDLVILPCSREEEPAAYLQRMVARRLVDGMIITATTRGDPRVGLLSRLRIPFVTLGRSGPADSHAYVDLDFDHAARDSVARLSAAGHRRIAAFLPAGEANLAHVYHDGYRAALETAGIAYDPDLVLRVPRDPEGAVTALAQWQSMADRPGATVMTDSLWAIGFYHALRGAGLEPGRDLALIGFLESRQTRFLSPALACYRFDHAAIGRALARRLLGELPRRDQAEARTVPQLFRGSFVAGASSGGA